MDKFIVKLPRLSGYKLEELYFHIYTNDAVLIADSKANLQGALYYFNQEGKQLNIFININEIKSRDTINCELEIDRKLINLHNILDQR